MESKTRFIGIILTLVGIVIAIEGIAMLVLGVFGTGTAGQMAKELEQQAAIFGENPEMVSMLRTIQIGLVAVAAYSVFKAIVGIGCILVGLKAAKK